MRKLIVFIVFSMLGSINVFAGNNIVSSELSHETQDNKIIEVLVEANAALDDVCDYFNGSWVDTGLKIYCTFNKTSAVCVVYKVVKVTCHINGAVRLLIEGDWSNGIRQSLIGATEVYQLTKVGRDEYELSPSRNYTPVDRY